MPLRVDVQGGGHADRLAGVPDALDGAVLGAGGLPAAQAAEVELPVGGAEPAAHHAGAEGEGETVDAALRDAVHRLGHDVVAARRRRSWCAASRPSNGPHLSPVDPDLPAAGVVAVLRHPADRLAGVVGGGVRWAIGLEAEERALVDEVDPRGGHPFALVVGLGELRRRAHAQAVAVADAGGEDFELVAVLVDLQHRAAVGGAVAALGVVEVPLGVGFEVGGVGVAVLR